MWKTRPVCLASRRVSASRPRLHLACGASWRAIWPKPLGELPSTRRPLELRFVLIGERPQPVRRQFVGCGEAEVGDHVQVGQPRHLASQHSDVRMRAWREPPCRDAACAEHDAAAAVAAAAAASTAAAAAAAVQQDLRALGSKTFWPLENLDARRHYAARHQKSASKLRLPKIAPPSWPKHATMSMSKRHRYTHYALSTHLDFELYSSYALSTARGGPGYGGIAARKIGRTSTFL